MYIHAQRQYMVEFSGPSIHDSLISSIYKIDGTTLLLLIVDLLIDESFVHLEVAAEEGFQNWCRANSSWEKYDHVVRELFNIHSSGTSEFQANSRTATEPIAMSQVERRVRGLSTLERTSSVSCLGP